MPPDDPMLAGMIRSRGLTLRDYDRETFLAQTCRKAGLPRDAWRDPATKLLGFEAEVFGEGQG